MKVTFDNCNTGPLYYQLYYYTINTFNGSQLGMVNLIGGSGASTTRPAERLPLTQPPSLALILPKLVIHYSSYQYYKRVTCSWATHRFPSNVFSTPILFNLLTRDRIIPPKSDFVYSMNH